MENSNKSKEPFPENLSLEEILTSIGDGVLLKPLPEKLPPVDMTPPMEGDAQTDAAASYMLRRMRKLHDPEDVFRAALPLLEYKDAG